MFKILILQVWYNIAGNMTEFQINDWPSFQRFSGLTLKDKVPDAKTIRAFREHPDRKVTTGKMFELYGNQLEEAELITRKGSIVDATFAGDPRQRNHRAGNADIKVKYRRIGKRISGNPQTGPGRRSKRRN